MKSYRDLEIYQISLELSLKIRELTLTLDSHDKYEMG